MFGEQGDQRGLAQRLDDALYRLESWRPVDRLTAIRTFCGLTVVALGAGWWYGQNRTSMPVEDLIPVAAPDIADDGPDSAEVGVPVGLSAGTESGGESLTPVSGQVANDEAEEPVAADERLVIHVIGAVGRPGLVSVPEGSRVDDVVSAAGGPTADAAIDRLNLAAPVLDGMQVRVPTVGEDDGGPLMIPASPAAASETGPAGVPVEAGPVNLNTASADQLDTLPGIGPATAAAIMRWREDNGGFHSLEDLLAVPGIGQAKMAAIQDLVTV